MAKKTAKAKTSKAPKLLPQPDPSLIYKAASRSGGIDIRAENVSIGGGVAGRDQIIIQPPSPEPVFYYPPPYNDFVGRDRLVRRVHSALVPSKKSGARPVALHGMSGVGKTRLAAEYAHRYRESYPGGIYWIDMTREWEDQVERLAELVGFRESPYQGAERRRLLMLAFSNFLNTHPRSLLILDGVNDFAALAWSDQSSIFKFAELRCRILVTTHSAAIGQPFTVIPVKALSESEALKLLLSVQERRITDRDRDAARTICGLLGHLPLAVSIAAAFLNERQDVSLAGYRDRLQQEGGIKVIDQTLGELVSPADYERAVGATLKLQWAALQNKSARFVLRAIAVLGGYAWVTRAQLALLTNLPDEAESGYPVPLETALLPLRRLSLIEETLSSRHRTEASSQEATSYADSPATSPDDSIHLHALVQDFVRQQIHTEGNEGRLKDQLERNLSRALRDAASAAERVIAVSECLLLAPDWEPPRLRKKVFKNLQELMNDAAARTLIRLKAALLLADLRWLDETWIALFPDAMLNYMEFIARYIDRDIEREYLEDRLSILLDGQERIKLDSREQAELLVFRAVLRAQRRKLLDATADYEEAWRLAGDTSNRLAARIKLGLANIIAGEHEDLVESADPNVRREAMAGLRSAVVLYWEADDFARRYGADAILRVIILKEIAYVYALLDKWGLGRRRCKQALGIVQQITDEGLRLIYLARVQEAESQVLFKQGMRLKASGFPTALLAFQAAYEIVQGEISLLDKYSVENYAYVLAHNNAGEYLLEESRCSNCTTPRLLLAKKHLTRALEVARRLKIIALERDARTLRKAVTARQKQIV